MKKRMLLIMMLFVLSILFSETILIQKTDGTNLQFELVEIIDMTFDGVVNEVIQINKTDGTTDEIGIVQIENIEFTETEQETMLINKTDGTTYEVETILIANITFNEVNSIEDTVELINSIPIQYLRNSPNPFNPETTISFELNEAGLTKIEIFNVKGQKVNTVLDKLLPIGSHNTVWNGLDDKDRTLSNGVYFYKISVDGNQRINKMLLLK